MLLQGGRTVQRPINVVPARAEQGQHREVPTPAPTVPVGRRTYAPITWEHPTLGRVVAEGVGGIARTSVLIVLLAALGVGTAMGIAILVTSLISGLGVDASAGY
ncbi:hypothetical protein [Paractinoplanes durhamensis]|uniref:Uncharacterized protein n=1 Tax=Paractinoplanes durhamensis TaxID=113563 RepID=A0ABQ3Z853_9ACTN|nr:hypothetical protein [Actinoplanes durhamensis]GIE06024.1 hypothetical protein Adu01nite_73740 [Actinoplanes durhamensis]